MVSRTLLLFLVIFVEGYIVLSAELLAIRQTLPFVGSGTDTVSIVIAAVLMPLAFGYYAGGRFRPHKMKDGSYMGVRRKLVCNLLIAGAILTAGLSFFLLSHFFEFLIKDLKWTNRLVLTTIYALLFITGPVYLLGQTVPLVSHYFGKAKLPQAAGKILFFSTAGSFLGAVFTTLFLMNFIGVDYAASFSIGCIAFLVLLLAKKKAVAGAASLLLFAVSAFFASPAVLSKRNVVRSNVYNTVQIRDVENIKYPKRHLILNGTYSSSIYSEEREAAFEYIKYIDNYFIKTFKRAGRQGEILVIGAGGFTVGHRDRYNKYVFVDIDPELKEIAEKKFLKEPIGKNREFVAMPARAYLRQTDRQFDLVFLDLGRGLSGVPEHLITQEFFTEVKKHVREGGIIVSHYFSQSLVESAFSRRLDNTFRSVFPHAGRQVIGTYNPWVIEEDIKHNSVLYIGRVPAEEDHMIYTDDLNRSMLDKSGRLGRP